MFFFKKKQHQLGKLKATTLIQNDMSATSISAAIITSITSTTDNVNSILFLCGKFFFDFSQFYKHYTVDKLNHIPRWHHYRWITCWRRVVVRCHWRGRCLLLLFDVCFDRHARVLFPQQKQTQQQSRWQQQHINVVVWSWSGVDVWRHDGVGANGSGAKQRCWCVCFNRTANVSIVASAIYSQQQ